MEKVFHPGLNTTVCPVKLGIGDTTGLEPQPQLHPPLEGVIAETIVIDATNNIIVNNIFPHIKKFFIRNGLK